MTYTPNVPAWADAPSTQSPINAARLNHIEQGIQTALAAVGQAGNATSIQGTAVATTPPATGQILQFNGTQWVPSGSGGAGNATQLNGIPINTTPPTNGATLTYSSVAGQWVAVAPGSFAALNLPSLSVGTTDGLGTSPATSLLTRLYRPVSVTDNARALNDEAQLATVEDHAVLGGMFANPAATYSRFGQLIYQANTIHSNMTRTAGLFVSAGPWAVDNGVQITDCAAIWTHHDISTVTGQPESAKMANSHYGVLAHIGALFGSASNAFGFHSEIARFSSSGLAGYDNSANFHVAYNNATKLVARGFLIEPFWHSPASGSGYGMNFAMPDYPSQHIGPLGVNGNFLGGTANDNIGFEAGSHQITFTGNVSGTNLTMTGAASDGSTNINVDFFGHQVTGPGIPGRTYITGGFGAAWAISQTATTASGTYTIGETRVARHRGLPGAARTAIPSGNLVPGMLAYQTDGFFNPNAGWYYVTTANTWGRILDGSSFNFCDPTLSAIFDLQYVTIGTTDNIQTGIGTRLRIKDLATLGGTGDSASFTFEISKIPAAGVTQNIYGLTVGSVGSPTTATIASFNTSTVNNLTGINTFFTSGGSGTFGTINGVWAQAGHTSGGHAGAVYGVRGTALIPTGANTGGATFLIGGNFAASHVGTGGAIGTACALYLTAPNATTGSFMPNAETYRYTNTPNGPGNIAARRGYGPWAINTTDGAAHQIGAVPLAVDLSQGGTGVTTAGGQWLEIHVVGHRTGGTVGTADSVAGYQIGVITHPDGSNIVTSQMGVAKNDASWGNPTVTAGLGALAINVTGAANQNIAWVAWVDVMSIGS